MKITNKILAACAVCLLSSFSVFSQLEKQASDKYLAANEAKRVLGSLVSGESKSVKPLITTVKRQSGGSENWKGFYIGGNVGGTISNHSLVASTAFCGGFNGTVSGTVFVFPANGCYFAQSSVDLVNRAGNQKAKPKGFTGGGQAGYNFQSGKFVVGVEADFNFVRQNRTVIGRDTYTSVTPQYQFQVTQTIKSNWLMTVRPRAGFTTGKALIYGTGGLAVTNLNYQMNFEDFPPNPAAGLVGSKGTASKTINQTKAGWTAGGGVEFKVNDNWSMKGEYLYTQFNANGTSNNLSAATINSSGGVNGTASVPAQVFTSNLKMRANHFRFGFNYRF